MSDHKDQFPIQTMSKVFGVSRSGYYSWAKRAPSNRSVYNKKLSKAIKKVWQESYKLYGSPRIHQQLLRKGWQASRPRVARLMKAMGIASQIRAKWTQTTDSGHNLPVAENLLDRAFFPKELATAWVGDITYIPSIRGWLYLTTVMDLADRQIIGWSLSHSMCAEVTSIAALKAALNRRAAPPDLLFHSDRGIQYACGDFTQLLASHGITQSMSRKGNCWDNAPAESFFKTIKHEMTMPKAFGSYKQARTAIFEFIEIWYNRKRLHSALGYKTPAEAEQDLTKQQAA